MRSQCSKLVQFANPLRPCNMTNLDYCFSPQTKSIGQIRIPQSTRPPFILISPKSPTPTRYKFPYQYSDQSGSPKNSLLSPSNVYNNVSYPYYMPETRFASQAYADCYDIPVAAPPVFKAKLGGEVREDNEEEVEEIIRGILELYERLPSSLRDKVALEIMKKEMSKQNGLNVGSNSTTTSTRGIDGSVEHSFLKLERFKVKTVIVGDVINDDEKKDDRASKP